MNPQPIDTAPQDGSVILTDCGFARYVNPKQWASPVGKGWAECDPFGNIYECADDGYWLCTPKQWTPVPEWIK